jgi:hypothetical protein
MSLYWWFHPWRTLRLWRLTRRYNQKYLGPRERAVRVRDLLHVADEIRRRGNALLSQPEATQEEREK